MRTSPASPPLVNAPAARVSPPTAQSHSGAPARRLPSVSARAATQQMMIANATCAKAPAAGC